MFLLDIFPPHSQDLASYLDPGSGSFLLQIILASFLGALFVVKSYWKKLSGKFRKNPPEQKMPTDDHQ